MMKKFAMAVAAASLLGAAYAESCASSVSGFYAGAQVGLNSTNGTTKDTVTDTAAAPNNRQDSSTFGKKSFLGGIFTGYGMGVGSCAYVGGEFYVNFGNAKVNLTDSTTNTNPLTSKLSSKTAFGAKVRLGYTVTPQSMLFLGLGVERSQWTFNKTAAAGNTKYNVKKSKNSVKFAPSVGMDMFVNKNLFVRGEYTYVLPTKIKDSAASGTVNFASKVSASQQRFTLGLGYKF